jgi:hypothetical protein
MAANDSPADRPVPSVAVLRPGIRGSDNLSMTVCLIVLGGIGAGLGFAILAQKGDAAGLLIAIAGLLAAVLLPVLFIWQYTIVITPETVALHRLGRKPKGVANRAEIANAQWQHRQPRGSSGGFVDANGAVLLDLGPIFPSRQVKKIAAMLGVPYKSSPARPR